MKERFYGRRQVHSADGSLSADIECWELNGEIQFRTMVYNENIFLVSCRMFNNEDDAEDYVRGCFMPAELVEGKEYKEEV